MYDKKTKPLRACVPVDPFENAPRCRAVEGFGRRRRRRGGGGGRRSRQEGRMRPITMESVQRRAALDFGA